MIFQHTWQQVLDGTKTQTRRVVRKNDFAANFWGGYIADLANWNSYFHIFADGRVPDNRGRLHIMAGGQRPKYTLGNTYAVQPGRGQRAIGRIRITGLRREDVRTISDADVKAEGFNSRDEFLTVWTKMHKNYDAWVIEFELVKEAQP